MGVSLFDSMFCDMFLAETCHSRNNWTKITVPGRVLVEGTDAELNCIFLCLFRATPYLLIPRVKWTAELPFHFEHVSPDNVSGLGKMNSVIVSITLTRLSYCRYSILIANENHSTALLERFHIWKEGTKQVFSSSVLWSEHVPLHYFPDA